MEIRIDPEIFRPVIEMAIEAILQRQEPFEDRLAYNEREAAKLLGMHSNQLCQERLLGRIKCFRVGKVRGVRYTRKALLDYIAAREREESLRR